MCSGKATKKAAIVLNYYTVFYIETATSINVQYRSIKFCKAALIGMVMYSRGCLSWNIKD